VDLIHTRGKANVDGKPAHPGVTTLVRKRMEGVQRWTCMVIRC
jgi:hypothetical protein